jgi:hypothetical protein
MVATELALAVATPNLGGGGLWFIENKWKER